MDTTNPDNRKYAWVLVRGYRNGRVHADAYGFAPAFGETLPHGPRPT